MKNAVSVFQKLGLSMVNFRSHWAYDKTPFAFRGSRSPQAHVPNGQKTGQNDMKL